MLQLIAPGLQSRPAHPERHRLIDPEFLEELANRSPGPGSDEAALVSDLFSAALHEMRIGGTWKRTARGRLRATEAALARFFAGGPQRPPLTLLDLGASDGITTFEAVAALRLALGVEVRAYLADRSLSLCRFRRGMIVEYRSSDGEPVLARVGPIGLRLAKQRLGLEEGHDAIARLYLGCSALRSTLRPDGRIPLVNPVAQKDAAIIPIEMDCLERNPALIDAVDAVRASNLLHLSYFTAAQILAALGHVHAYLREGGALVVSRNDDTPGGEVERGSIWGRRADRFERRDDFGNGAEIGEIVDRWRATGREARIAEAL